MQLLPVAVHPLAIIKNLGKNTKTAVAVAIQQSLEITIITNRVTVKTVLSS